MSTLDNSDKTTVPVSPTKGDNGEKEDQQQVINDLKLELETARKEKEEIRVLTQVQSDLHVLKKEQQGKKRVEWAAFIFNICLLGLSLGSLMQADVSWWRWWHNSVEGRLYIGETSVHLLSFFYANLLFSLFKFLFVYFP